MNLRRNDGEQLPAKFVVVLPPGLSAAPGGPSKLCPEVGTATGFCPPSSRVGSVVAQFGSGPNPATLTGSAYLSGPYRRAAFGMVMAFRAALGPLDLGIVSLRAAVRVDRRTGQTSIESDQFPELIEGISVRLRSLRIDLDQEGFIRNGTSCSPSTFVSTVSPGDGAPVVTTSPYALTGCDKLGFEPKFSVDLGGKGQLRRGGHPQLGISTKVPRRNANLRAFKLWLPEALRFDSSGLKEICARSDAIRGLCTGDSQVGVGSARTSLLDDPLKGPVYLVQPKGNGFPDLWLSLRGMGIRLDLGGESLVKKGRFVTRFVDLPDMPLSSLKMRLRGGDGGLLTFRVDPCSSGGISGLGSRASAKGQNGIRRRLPVSVKTTPPCKAP
jgi:hypothetical protein